MSDIDKYKAAVGAVRTTADALLSWGTGMARMLHREIVAQHSESIIAALPILDAMAQRVAELEGSERLTRKALGCSDGEGTPGVAGMVMDNRTALRAKLAASEAARATAAQFAAEAIDKLAASEARVQALVEALEVCRVEIGLYVEGFKRPAVFELGMALECARAALYAARDGGERPTTKETEA